MKNLKCLAAALAVLLLSSSGAFALSTEQGTMNSDGTPKFSDPDEQTPPGLVSPDSGNVAHLSGPLSGPSVTMPTAPQMMGVDQGGQAFDHAYGHVTNQNQ